MQPLRAGTAVLARALAVLTVALAAAVTLAVAPAGATRTVYPPIGTVILATSLPAFTAAPPGPTNGPLTATGFAAQSPDPQTATRQFEQLATVPGFAASLRLWTDVHGPGAGANDVVITLYRIPESAVAATFTLQLRQQYAVGATRFAVPSIPGATGYTSEVTSPSPATEQVVVFRSGVYVAIVELASSRQAANPTLLTPAEAVDISFRQFTATGKAAGRPVPAPAPAPAPAPSGGGHGWIVFVLVGLLVVAAGAGGLIVADRRRKVRQGHRPVNPDPFAPDGILAAMGAIPAGHPGPGAPDGPVDAGTPPAGTPAPAGVPEAPPPDGTPAGRPPAPPAPGTAEAGPWPGPGAPDADADADADGVVDVDVDVDGVAAGEVTDDGGPGTPATPVGRLDEPAPGTGPGWLPDPSGAPDQVRFWDGLAWTPHVAVRSPDR